MFVDYSTSIQPNSLVFLSKSVESGILPYSCAENWNPQVAPPVPESIQIQTELQKQFELSFTQNDRKERLEVSGLV